MRADRLISMILTLHARGRMTAAELASQMEVSERTIYRDVEALGAAGIPVYTQPGQNGGVFMDEDYRVALTDLSTPEVRALFVSSGGGPLKDLGLSRPAEHTMLKLMAALPYRQRTEAQRMRQRFHIDPHNWFQVVELSPYLPLLQQAVWEDHVITVEYHPVEGANSQRKLEAYGLVAKANLWYLVAHKPGSEMRTYRVSRFSDVALTGERFERDPAFDLAAYWDAARAQFEQASSAINPPYSVVLRVHDDAIWYFPAYMSGRYETLEALDGWTTVRVQFDSLLDARMRVLGLGPSALVIEPDALRDAVFSAAHAIIAGQ
jgi:predicted DNA-binding transcriptional regulator YafY